MNELPGRRRIGYDVHVMRKENGLDVRQHFVNAGRR